MSLCCNPMCSSTLLDKTFKELQNTKFRINKDGTFEENTSHIAFCSQTGIRVKWDTSECAKEYLRIQSLIVNDNQGFEVFTPQMI